jgi:UDP-hydrolysing UDP-N-acetyl-D-glucosamine 2-epimerase
VNPRRICFVITARASYARSKSFLLHLIRDTQYEINLILAASAVEHRFGNLESEIRGAGIPVGHRLNVLMLGNSLLANVQETGLLLLKLSELFNAYQPNAVVTVADRYETVATAIAASYLNLPLIHIQGGEVTGNIDDKVRNAVTKLSDYHFVSSEGAAKRVQQMHAKKETVFITGCPSVDIARDILERDTPQYYLDRLSGISGVGAAIKMNAPFCIVILHSETEREGQSGRHAEVLIESLKLYNGNVIWFWPNSDAGGERIASVLRRFRENDPAASRFTFIKTLPPEDALLLLKRSQFLVGNSSLGVRESGFLGVPSINIGIRQRDRYRGEHVVDVDFHVGDISAAISNFSAFTRCVSDLYYGDGYAGRRMKDATDEIFSNLLNQ